MIKSMWWNVQGWYLRQLLNESLNMSREHYNIARNDLEDHYKKKKP